MHRLGHGISKHTWAATHPVQCYNWIMAYLPAAAESSNCREGHYCDCATQGRTHTTAEVHAQGGFSLHTINCTFHPYGELSIHDIETEFKQKINDFTSGYDGFMDYNMGFWTNDLDIYIQKFQADSVPFLSMKWMSGGKQYYR